jgi:putative DNA primase/helicase
VTKTEDHLHPLPSKPAAPAASADDELAPAATKEDLEYAVAKLAKYTPLELDIVAKEWAARLGVKVTTLVSEVKKARRAGGAEVMQPHWKVELWPQPVSPSDVLARIKRRLKRHVFMTDEAATATSLWVMFAWVHEAAVHSPILLVSSPEAECGKSTLLGLINYLVPRGCIIVDVSSAVLFRMIEKWHPTLIVDEADDAFKGNPELRGVINSGWTRGAGVPRCQPETHEPEFFETFGPKAIGLKGLKVPGTTLSRSIIVDMERKLPGDEVEDFSHVDDEGLARIRQQLARFADDNMAALAGKTPQMPDGFANRLRANWILLLAIAELCGPKAAEQARKAAEALSRRADEASLGVELLRDIRDDIFKPGASDRIGSEALVNALVNMADRPWREMPWPYTGKPITQVQLAKLLKPFKVGPKQIRFSGGVTLKGYQKDAFEKAFRYIPAAKPEEEEDGDT